MDVNNSLNSLRYTVPNGDFNSVNHGGNVAITVLVTDLGNTGLPGALSDLETFNLSITPTNDSPTINTPVGLALSEGAARH